MITKNKEKITKLLNELSIEEKAQLCCGRGNWYFRGIERLGIKEITVSDGPHGLRKTAIEGSEQELECSEPATCFPTASGLAASWNRELIYQVGKTIEKEAATKRISIVLGPGANIKRNPLCGRNFEYFSEDPFLSGELSASMILGIQNEGTGTSLKHFVVNNQEELRMTIDAIVDERTLREIYLAGFERAIKKASPWTIMCAYNKLNGTYLSDNKYILNDILREEWGFKGLVVSDWGACNDRVKALEAGMEVEMPDSGQYNVEEIVKAVNNGKLEEEVLDRATLRILQIVLAANEKLNNEKSGKDFDIEAHHKMAKEAAAESIVLLKNDKNVLPLSKNDKIAVVGSFAKTPRFQGAGSSHINPTKTDCFWDELIKVYPDAIFSEGYDLDNEIPEKQEELRLQAVAATEGCNKIIILCGLPDKYESEGFDRKNIKMPESHTKLIEELIKTGKQVIVCLSNGSPIEMPWHNDVSAIIENYLHGQAGASALLDILTGETCPSGKLAESFPLCLEDVPSNKYFPGGPRQVEYREGIYIGYRYFTTSNKPVLFPFGYGLSYTSFNYTNINIKKGNKDFEFSVEITIKNIGEFTGKETVQVYIAPPSDKIHRPSRELKGFEKIELAPHEEKTITIPLDFRSFACWSSKLGKWVIAEGKYSILVAASSEDVRLSAEIELTASDHGLAETSELSDYFSLRKDESRIHHISDKCFEGALGYSLPENVLPTEWSRTTTITDFSKTWIGKIIYRLMKKQAGALAGDSANSAGMFEAQAKEMPLRAIAQLSGKKYNMEMVDALILLGRKKLVGGAIALVKAIKKLN